mgnify:CR=1 FL=1
MVRILKVLARSKAFFWGVSMRRVVVTGMGIVSSIGGCLEDVMRSLRDCTSGISVSEDHKEYKFKSWVMGYPKLPSDVQVDRKVKRFTGDGAYWAYLAMIEAIRDSGLEDSDISNDRTGLVAGSGGVSTADIYRAFKIMEEKLGPKRMGPFVVPRTMGSTVSANLATAFKIRGVSYSISSACSTSAHCIGNAKSIIESGRQDIIFAGGGEEISWTLSCFFDAMGALSSLFNETDPERAARAFDISRDGFVIAGGGGIIVLEELEHARARGAKIYAEVVGVGENSDGYDMVQPSGEGAVRCMNMALDSLYEKRGSSCKVDYINAHGTSTPIGDVREIEAIKKVFACKDHAIPYVSSSKSIAGHPLGAAGVHEAIYSLLMMKYGFIGGSAHIQQIMPEAEDVPIVCKTIESIDVNTVMSNSFGFGGTNATLIFSKLDD